MVRTIPLGNDPEAARKIGDQIDRCNSETTAGKPKDNDDDNFANEKTESILLIPNLEHLPGPPSSSSIPLQVDMPQKYKGSAINNSLLQGIELLQCVTLLLSFAALLPNQEQYPVIVPKIQNSTGINKLFNWNYELLLFYLANHVFALLVVIEL